MSRFRVGDHLRKVTINYVGFYFYIIDFLYQEEFPKYLPRFKAAICVSLIKEIKRSQGLSNLDLFKHCRGRDRMKVSDFEDIFQQLVEVDVYGDDV